MKTTINLSTPLLKRARMLAIRRGTTLGALIEEGLRQVLAERRPQEEFRLRRASFGGQGLCPDVAAAGWDRLRALSYSGPPTATSAASPSFPSPTH